MKDKDTLTAQLASFDYTIENEILWADEALSLLAEEASANAQCLSINDLKKIYTISRLIQGSIVSSHLALPTAISLCKSTISGVSLSDSKAAHQLRVKTTEFLNGCKDHNDYPVEFIDAISIIASLIVNPFNEAFDTLKHKNHSLFKLGCDADHIHRLSWALMRKTINKKISSDIFSFHRQMDLEKGTEKLLSLIKNEFGVSIPARVIQRDNWEDALEKPRQSPEMALFNSTKYFIENAEIALSYGLGSLLIRKILMGKRYDFIKSHIRYAAQDISAGSYKVTHKALFQSRIGARPNDFRSFLKFIDQVKNHVARVSISEDGEIYWQSHNEEKGWCPAKNLYSIKSNNHDLGYAKDAKFCIENINRYSLENYEVIPKWKDNNAIELFSAAVVFQSIDKYFPISPFSNYFLKLSDSIKGTSKNRFLKRSGI